MGAMSGGAEAVDRAFAAAVSSMSAGAGGLALLARAGLSVAAARELFASQAASRHVDFAARWLRSKGRGYYTIGSAGHEGNAVVARLLRIADTPFLHYRSAAFFIERARQVAGTQPLRDILLGVVGARAEPIAGGRHKVFGSVALNIPPQTSTIASHLPKAVGAAFAGERARHLGVGAERAADAIVVCSFGDASANHSTAVGAINAAGRIACHLPCPILFVCEDNGLGISVRTPPQWIERAFGQRANLSYFAGDGCELASAYASAAAAIAQVRRSRRPGFLHLRMVRLMGHAGADVEMVYRSRGEIAADLARDPLVASARLLIASGAATPAEVIEVYESARREVAEVAESVLDSSGLSSAVEVMAPLAPHTPAAIASQVGAAVDVRARSDFWAGELPELGEPLTLAGHINRTLGDLLCADPELLVFGMDVGRKGGVYGVTRGLDRRAGMGRVFDTILDEQSILGLAIGAAQVGFLPIAEIQYLAYLHNAEDQLRGEAASLQFFSQGQFRNPMVVRIAAFAYQKGFGGHFHNDNSIAVLRDIPGLIIAAPSRGDDAAAMLRSCVAAARVDGAVCVFLEPIALYNSRDLFSAGDGELLADYDPAPAHVAVGAARLYGEGRDLLLVSFANGVGMSRRAARRLHDDDGVACQVLDLRWLAPLPIGDLLAAAGTVDKLLIVDETRASGGVSEGVIAALVEGGYRGAIRRVVSRDSFIPLGDAAAHVLVGEAEIVTAARALVAKPGR